MDSSNFVVLKINCDFRNSRQIDLRILGKKKFYHYFLGDELFCLSIVDFFFVFKFICSNKFC